MLSCCYLVEPLTSFAIVAGIGAETWNVSSSWRNNSCAMYTLLCNACALDGVAICTGKGRCDAQIEPSGMVARCSQFLVVQLY